MLVSVITLTAAALAIYVSPFVPMLVAIVTKSTAASWLKAGLLIVLSAVAAAVAPVVQNGGSINLDAKWLGSFATVVALAEVSHFLGKAAGITGSDGVLARKVPGGIG